MKVLEIQPVLAKDIEISKPPPSYEEIMGQFVTSVTPEHEELPPLSYIDIMPRLVDPGNMKNKIPPTFEKFRSEFIAPRHPLPPPSPTSSPCISPSFRVFLEIDYVDDPEQERDDSISGGGMIMTGLLLVPECNYGGGGDDDDDDDDDYGDMVFVDDGINDFLFLVAK